MEGQVRILKESERARVTHELESINGVKHQDNEREPARDMHSHSEGHTGGEKSG
jgi:hypothetical protein